jgi:hypothetical protein
MATRTNRPSQFGAEAPPKNLTLPEGNVTLYEQLVFLPNSVRNLDVVLRFAYNGVHQEAVSRIVEHGRVLPKDCKVNTALKIMQYGPRFRLLHIPGPGVKWTPEKAFNEDRPDNWDKTNLSWNGCRLDTLYKSGCGPVVDNVPFENLARGVKNMPTGYDALDLTRCVEVAQKSPGVYKFPRDFPAILQQLGGPAVVRYGNLDAAVARRYTRNSVVFKRHLEAGLITDPDDKLVARAVPDTTTIGNSSFSSSTISSSAADKASSNDGKLALRTNQYIKLTILQVLIRLQVSASLQLRCQQTLAPRSPVLVVPFRFLRVRFTCLLRLLLLHLRAPLSEVSTQRFPVKAPLQVFERLQMAVSQRICPCHQELFPRSPVLVMLSNLLRVRSKRLICPLLLRLCASSLATRAQRFPEKALLQVFEIPRIAVPQRLRSCQQALVLRSPVLVMLSNLLQVRCKGYPCLFCPSLLRRRSV